MDVTKANQKSISTMGPPKRRPKKTPYDEVKRRYDCFEYRWNKESKGYYLFNPWTGETIFDTNLEMLDRSKSMWTTPDRFPSDIAQNVMLYPEFYASRRWGRRRFTGWESPEAAATQIAAVGRGYLARKAIRNYYRARFYTKIDPFSGYFFFVDNMNPDLDTVWYKPRLAFPGDILPFEEEDPQDYMKGKKYSRQDFTVGPIYKVAGVSKRDMARADLAAFYADNPWRNIAVKSYTQIDLENSTMGSVVSWFDSEKAVKLKMSAFNVIRVALTNFGWAGVLKYMKANPQDIVLQMYGFHSFSKTDVTTDESGILSFDGNEALECCVEVIRDEERMRPELLKLFALEAMHNILSMRPGRVEYLNAQNVPEQGELRQAAVEKFYESRFSIFIKYLKIIPNETISVYSKGQNKPESIKKPLPRSVDMVELTIKCLSLLAQEIETKEQLALLLVQPLFFALDVCKEEAGVVLNGLRLLYNLCYRCESGQEAVLAYCEPKVFLGTVRHHHSGDFDVMRQSRRLELSLMQFGWRGNVEEIITREMRNEEVDEEYLQTSEHVTKK